MGLAIVKQLTELHGGAVVAKSGGVGQGATFVVRLPVSPILAREASQEHPASEPYSTRRLQDVTLAGVKVLVVDDEADARELVKRVLAGCGASVEVAGSASEAISHLATLQPDVIVSDIGMPDTDGYQFIREVRKRPASDGGKTPAIALTAFARSEDRTRAMMAGYQVHISKPIEPRELVATVASLAGRIGGNCG